jgi:hypothetical protein
MLKKVLLSFSLLLSLYALASKEQKPLEIVHNGKSSFIIVLSSQATQSDNLAAKMLQGYIQKMSGCLLSILVDDKPSDENQILINVSNKRQAKANAVYTAKLKEDGFVIIAKSNGLQILSGGRKGSIYGVVNLLEKQFGCRKYSPTATVIPQHKDLIIKPGVDFQNPVNSFRVVYGEFANDMEYRDWERMSVVDEVFADGYYVHTSNRLVPWDKYFTEHPEYFCYMGSKRLKDQLCLSNPEVFKLVVAKLKEDMALQPDKKLWSVSQNDNFSYCQCDECKKIIDEEGSPAGPIIRFVNKVAAQFPDKMISTLAYQFSRQAPKITKPADNVQIMLCTIELNRSKPIESDTTSKSFLKDIVDWGKISKHIYLWDYTVNFSHHVTPFPNLHVLQPNIQFFVKNGAHEHFQQSNTSPGHEFSELKSYILARLLWNPDVNVDSVKNDFLTGYYGAGGAAIGKYIDRLQSEILKTGERLDIYDHPFAHSLTFLSEENLKAYQLLFDEAEKAVENQPVYLQRVKTARLPIQYATMEIGKNDLFGPRGYYQYDKVSGEYVLRQDMKQMIEDFHTTCLANNVTSLSEAGLTPEAYYTSSLRFIDVKVKGNLAFSHKVTANPMPDLRYNRGDVRLLTNGVQGSNDYRVHWLGWEGMDFELVLDLDSLNSPKEISISSLYDPKSWILHPKSVTCEVSEDGATYREIGKITVDGDQKNEELTKQFLFNKDIGKCRYVRFQIESTKQLFDWHASAGNKSWVFIDEIIVR